MPDSRRFSRLAHASFFHRFRVSIHRHQTGVHGAFWALASSLPFLDLARANNISVAASYSWPVAASKRSPK
jgi:hypothetical protein